MTRAPRLISVPEGGFRSIAVLRLSSLGDVVLTLPAVEALRARWPQARLHYWTKEEFADVVRFHPAIDHVRELEKDARRIEDIVSMSAELEDCDLIVDLHRNARTRMLTFRQKGALLRGASDRWLRERWVRARWSRPAPARHALERYAAALRPIGLDAPGVPRVHAGAEATAWAQAWWREWSPAGPVVALAPAARHATKQWPAEHWAALDRRMADAEIQRLYLSTAKERTALESLATQVVGRGARWFVGSLARVTALLAHCQRAITNDSGLMHLAAASGLPVIALFGSTVPELGFAPAGEGHVVLCRHESCQPCTLHGRESCPRDHFRCMRAIEPGDVFTYLAATGVERQR